MGAPEAFTATTDVGHCIGGRAVRRHQRPRSSRSTTRPPAQVARQVALACGRRSGRRGGRRQGRVPGLGRHAADPPRARAEQLPGSC